MFNLNRTKPLQFSVRSDNMHKEIEYFANEASVHIALELHADLVEMLERHGWKQRGRYSWATSVGQNIRGVREFITEAFDKKVPAGQQSGVYYANNEAPCYKNGCTARRGAHAWRDHAEDTIINDVLDGLKYTHSTNLGNITITPGQGDMVWFRVSIDANDVKDIVKEDNVIDIPRERWNYLKPIDALSILDRIDDSKPAGGNGLASLTDGEETEAVIEKIIDLDSTVAVGYVPNEPSAVTMRLGFGVNTRGLARSALRKYKAGQSHTVKLDEVIKLRNKFKDVRFIIHPALEDIVNMKGAQPYEGDARLRDYQKVAVGLHLSTRIGYLQSCSTGMGKTVMTLAAMNERSKTIDNYRGLVVCEANVREQWAEEVANWFPNSYAHIVETPDKQESIDALIGALSHQGPSIIITSYSTTLQVYAEMEERKAEDLKIRAMSANEKMRYLASRPIADISVGAMLHDSFWNDIAADEAVVIRNNSSKQAKAMWHIRQKSEIAVALTATPLNKSPDDVARLVAWVRNDPYMFAGQPLDEVYDTTSEKDTQKLYRNFEPLVFRRNTGEASDALPTANPAVTLLTASPQEDALINAATNELRRCYNELVAALEAVEVNKGDKDAQEALAAAKEQLKEARGAWLGGKTLARMATSDPAAIKESNSVGAALLDGQGLIDAAMGHTPTKREEFIKQAVKRIENGEQIIVFTSFARVARLLTKALNDAGISAKSFTGANGATRDQARREFQKGELDVLVCTKAAERGLTLHKASALYHYDLPWTLEEIIQRTGRAIRIGSENEVVDIVFMIMEGTIEQDIAEKVVHRAIQSSLIMDAARGVDVGKTDVATAVGGLVGAVRTGSKELAIGEKLFGALIK